MTKNSIQSFRSLLGEFARAWVVVLIFFVFDVLVVFFLQGIMPMRENGFPYLNQVLLYRLPFTFQVFTHFDGAQFIAIAAEGRYFTFQQAYFPLFPLLMRVVGRTFLDGNVAVAGLFISHISLTGAVFFMQRIADKVSIKYKHEGLSFPHPLVLLLLVLPCSFFFSAVYTESLFLLLLVASLYALLTKQYKWIMVLGFLLSFTRLVGIFFILPLAFSFLFEKARSVKIMLVFGMVSILGGLGAYMLYLWNTTGDALMFLHAQSVFNSTRSTNELILLPQVLYRYIKIFTTAALDVNYFVATVEFTTMLVYLGLLILAFIHLKKTYSQTLQWGMLAGLWAFSVANLILPTLTGTLSSIPRYSLLSLSALPVVLGFSRVWQWVFLGVSVALHIILLTLFAHGYFVS